MRRSVGTQTLGGMKKVLRVFSASVAKKPWYTNFR
jgi:hypothetical protein